MKENVYSLLAVLVGCCIDEILSTVITLCMIFRNDIIFSFGVKIINIIKMNWYFLFCKFYNDRRKDDGELNAEYICEHTIYIIRGCSFSLPLHKNGKRAFNSNIKRWIWMYLWNFSTVLISIAFPEIHRNKRNNH